MARPWTKFPPVARDLLMGMAASGVLTEAKAAEVLSMPLSNFRKVLKNSETATELWKDCQAVAADVLLQRMNLRSKDGDQKATAWLLATQHGLSEKSEGGGERVSVVFQLPAAMSPEQYFKAIEHQPARLK
jgi:hypothetical protein